MAKKRHGADAADMILKVPVGTVIYDEDSGKILADLTHDKQRVVIAKGGRGGRGNARFATSRNPAPTICERGEPGEKHNLICELKLLADVGLVGFPSVGKSTFLSVVTRAKPEIADYHFTTIDPNLGVVKTEYGSSFVLADIPGIIEGASEGVGLGIQFLRHVERTRLLLHFLDVSGQEGRNPVEDFEKILIPKSKWLKFVIKSQEPLDIQKVSRAFYEKFITSSKFKLRPLPELEYYYDNITEFLIPIED